MEWKETNEAWHELGKEYLESLFEADKISELEYLLMMKGYEKETRMSNF